MTERLLNPTKEHEREYEVKVDKKITGRFLKKLELGVDIEGYQTKLAKVSKINDQIFRIALTEGKKHQVRRMCAALGYQIRSLKRVRILNLTVHALTSGNLKELTKTDRDRFLKIIGLPKN